MFGSIYVGLSGMTAYSRGLQQVSNNVANMNSSGFKGSTVSFTDLYALNPQDGSNAGGNGGNGVSVGDPRVDMRQGELRQTERDLDLAVDGNGFMMLVDGDRILYTRTGSFEANRDGHIVLAGTDYRLAMLDTEGRPVSLSIDNARTSPPTKTTKVKFDGNLSYTGETSGATDTSFTINDVKVYDAGGGQHVWKVQFDEKSARGPREWDVTITDAKGTVIGTQVLKFSVGGTVDPTTSSLTFAKDDLSVALDFSGSVTSFSAGTVQSLRAASVDGRGAGTLATVTVNDKGQIELGYSNGDKKSLAAVAIAQFREPQKLEQRSGGLFVNNGADQPTLLASDDERVGRVVSRRLEASNVDLAKEFGELILIQRGFQASSQIVSASNDMIQQLFGIRGQG
ncbi:flagellar hook-basal body complex protein [Allosphingosinicella deserti]|uniref:Flagellar hook protein FlgE n=1 Tax=Allosphingosinicella deserti TaxID=2116704 RepID=A0A2P7QW52_9SPHN|nr:flagellar hook-basal body complex protein [Sphingomonas deserti]PSJ42201.1 hypothetical protein C7I55_08180 [Sphingomonas deserti]